MEVEAQECGKAVSALLLRSAHVARLLHGARTTSCKSAKDRTSVYTTLEVATAAVAERVLPGTFNAAFAHSPAAAASNASATSASGADGLLDADEERALVVQVANELRGEFGVRLGNCVDNMGRPKYSFNALQVQALPPDLRPPAHTAAGGAS